MATLNDVERQCLTRFCALLRERLGERLLDEHEPGRPSDFILYRQHLPAAPIASQRLLALRPRREWMPDRFLYLREIG